MKKICNSEKLLMILAVLLLVTGVVIVLPFVKCSADIRYVLAEIFFVLGAGLLCYLMGDKILKKCKFRNICIICAVIILILAWGKLLLYKENEGYGLLFSTMLSMVYSFWLSKIKD